ncbi:flavin reductase family protein [Streptomyces sp. NPDC098781]|uniref:flavin reductase family protein n=1 Tax=Streptomyces sp. NPDC098781 TaxID=3366097 RepID=UPI003806D93A
MAARRTALDAAPCASPDRFRELMSAFPTGVGVITAFRADGRPVGMTCSSICSVSLEPPTLLVALRNASPTLAAVLESSVFSLNFLHEGAREVAKLFASGDADRFDQVDWRDDGTCGGPHLVRAAHARADCRAVRHERVGDHTVVYGEVAATRAGPGGGRPEAIRPEAIRPLLYGQRRYATWPAA